MLKYSEAWDDTGTEYSLNGGFAEMRDAARALKHGARLGLLKERGVTGAIVWISVPAFEGSNALKALNRWLGERVAGIENLSLTHWRGVAGGGEVVLAWDDCWIEE